MYQHLEMNRVNILLKEEYNKY